MLFEVRVLPSHRDWEIVTFLLYDYISKGWLPKSLRNTFLNCKTGRRLGEVLYLKGKEKEFYDGEFSKVNALSEARSPHSGRNLSGI